MSRIRWLSCVLALSAWAAAHADTTTLSIPAATKGTSNVPVTMSFPIARTGDLGYATIFNYYTVNGTAVAGSDYTATSGTITIPANVAGATIPVTLTANTGNGASSQFQMVVDSAGAAPAFATLQSFATGNHPISAYATDLNGDGKLDLVVANEFSNTVSVLLNTAAPGASTASFATAVNFTTGTNPFSVIAVDVNGDGKPDLVVANNTDNTVSVLLNTTPAGANTPTFALQKTFATGFLPNSVYAADVNGDGKPDLIVTNSGDQTVSVLLNTMAKDASTASFATQQAFPTAPGGNVTPTSVFAADVNGDGKPDLIVGNSAGNTALSSISVLLNTTTKGASTANFAPQQTFSTGGIALYSVYAADINGDGKPDLIAANYTTYTVSVLLNTTAQGAGAPSFAAAQIFATGTQPSSVVAADVNGDGKPDLIVENDGDTTVSLLLNATPPGASTLSLVPQQTFDVGFSPYFVTAADMNGDGMPDLVVTTSNNSISVLLNTTAPAASAGFATQQTFATGSGPQSVAAADLNGDGKPDLIVANGRDTSISVLTNSTVAGVATPSFAAQQTYSIGNDPYSVVVVDLNGDGKPDLVAANLSDGDIGALMNTTPSGVGPPTFGTADTFFSGTDPYSVTTADLNGDGKPDLIAANYGNNTIMVFINTTATGASVPTFNQQAFTTGNNPYMAIAADLNGDGKPDLIYSNQGDNTVSVLLNTTTGGVLSFAAPQTFTLAPGSSPSGLAAADIDGDGKPDLIVAGYGNSSVLVLLNTTASGVLSFAAPQTFATGGNPYSVIAADVNGDLKPDLLVARSGSADTALLVNTSVAGNIGFAAQRTFASGNGPVSVCAADVNGDGKPDLIVANNRDNTVSVMFNAQYRVDVSGSPATGTIVHDYIFADGFGP